MSNPSSDSPRRPGRYEYLGTVRIARLFRVATRTVCKWIDDGRMAGIRTPGSSRRRVHREEIERFSREYQMPIHDDSPPAE